MQFLRNPSKKIAKAICAQREEKKFETTMQLANFIREIKTKREKNGERKREKKKQEVVLQLVGFLSTFRGIWLLHRFARHN